MSICPSGRSGARRGSTFCCHVAYCAAINMRCALLAQLPAGYNDPFMPQAGTHVPIASHSDLSRVWENCVCAIPVRSFSEGRDSVHSFGQARGLIGRSIHFGGGFGGFCPYLNVAHVVAWSCRVTAVKALMERRWPGGGRIGRASRCCSVGMEGM
jgi:hypothetical protein